MYGHVGDAATYIVLFIYRVYLTFQVKYITRYIFTVSLHIKLNN